MGKLKVNNPYMIAGIFKQVCEMNIDIKNDPNNQYLLNYLIIDRDENKLMGDRYFPSSNNNDAESDNMIAAYLCGNLNYINKYIHGGDFINNYQSTHQDLINLLGFDPLPANPQPTPTPPQPTPTPPQPTPTPPQPTPTPPQPDCSKCPSSSCPKPNCDTKMLCTKNVCAGIVNSNSNCNKLTTSKELLYSLIGALLFLVLSLPILYSLTNYLFSNLALPTVDKNMKPTYFGLLLHFIVYFLVIFGIMKLLVHFNKN
jgi:hypothetical protein